MAIVDGIPLSALGKKNMAKLIATGQYPRGPNDKKCQVCHELMDWRINGSLKPRKDKDGKCSLTCITMHTLELVLE